MNTFVIACRSPAARACGFSRTRGSPTGRARSRYPPRRFCSVTGLAGKYKCPITGDYLATLDAYNTHRETRLKGLV